MAFLEGKTPAERNKMIAAIAFGALALLLLGRMFLSSDTPTQRRTPTKSTVGTAGRPASGSNNGDAQSVPADQLIQMPRELAIQRVSYSAPDAGRNIFAFYVAPTPQPKASVEVVVPTPTPEPPPPLMLGAISPASVVARTGDFALQLSGDKFTPEARVYVDGQELPTTFASAQQLSTTVPAALISAPGARTIVVRTPDNLLYSNQTTLNVAAPPTPQYTFIGILGGSRYNDKAILKAQNNDLVTVQRGDTIAGRFKVTSISTRAVEFTDAQLQIKHTLPYVENRSTTGGAPGGPSSRFNPPPPKPADDDGGGDDDEPQD